MIFQLMKQRMALQLKNVDGASCNIYVHFMRKKLYVQTTRTNYTVNIRDAEFTVQIYGSNEYDQTDRIFTDEYDQTDRIYESYEYEFTNRMSMNLRIVWTREICLFYF